MVAQPVCRYCGAENPAAYRCWLCGELAPLGTNALGAVEPPKRTRQPDLALNLSTPILLIAGLAVALGVFLLAPGLAIALLILATPAMVRASRHHSQTGESGFGIFFTTLGITVGLIVAAFAAFFVICLAIVANLNISH
jgi:hypothetical protein